MIYETESAAADSAELLKLPAPPAPYRGIESFRMVDEPILFARESDRRRLRRFVTVYRGILLYGDSGVGKSSLVNAGLIPDAVREEFTPERVRVQPRRGHEFVIERISLTADDQPPFLPSNFIDDGDRSLRPTISVDAFLERARGIPRDQQPLLIFDQFEEFFTLFEEAPRGGEIAAARESQEQILNVLVEVLNNHSLPLKLVFSFREEYLPKLTKLFQRVPSLSDQAVRLTAPETEAIESIIAEPLRKFPTQFGNKFPDDLISHLIAAFHDRFQDEPVNLSEVQIACWQLWRAEEPSALFADRGLSGLLEDFFLEQLGRIPEEERILAIALLARMITRSGARNYISRGDLISLVQLEVNADAERLEHILSVLDDRTKLVRRELRQNVTYYTIVSEFLVPWIQQRNADRLREWEQLKTEQRLAEERAEADRRITLERNEVERERATRRARDLRRALIGAFTVIFILAVMVRALFAERSATRQAVVALQDTTSSLRIAQASLQAVQDSLERFATVEQRSWINRLTEDSIRLEGELAHARQRLASSDSVRFVERTDAGRRIQQLADSAASLRAMLQTARTEVDSLRLATSRIAATLGTLRRQFDSLHVVYDRVREERELLLRAREERDTLLASRERWLPVVLTSLESNDDEERDAARAICAVDPWQCRPRRNQ